MQTPSTLQPVDNQELNNTQMNAIKVPHLFAKQIHLGLTLILPGTVSIQQLMITSLSSLVVSLPMTPSPPSSSQLIQNQSQTFLSVPKML